MNKQANTQTVEFNVGDRVTVCNAGTDNNPLPGEIVDILKGWYKVALDESYTREMDDKEIDEVSARASSLEHEEESDEDEPANEAESPDEEGMDEDDEQTVGSKMAEALRQARQHYVKAKRPDGSATAHNGDLIARVLLESEPLEVCSFADTICEQDDGFHAARYAALNNGQKRMNSGNKIRAAYRKALELGDEATIAHIFEVLGIDAETDLDDEDPESSDADFEGNTNT